MRTDTIGVNEFVQGESEGITMEFWDTLPIFKE